MTVEMTLGWANPTVALVALTTLFVYSGASVVNVRTCPCLVPYHPLLCMLLEMADSASIVPVICSYFVTVCDRRASFGSSEAFTVSERIGDRSRRGLLCTVVLRFALSLNSPRGVRHVLTS